MSDDMPQVTQRQFEADYAKKSGRSIEELRAGGFHSQRHRCEEGGCQGWEMLSTPARTLEERIKYFKERYIHDAISKTTRAMMLEQIDELDSKLKEQNDQATKTS